VSDARAEQIAYYRARAAEYDDEAYESKNDDWKSEMARLVSAFEAWPLDGASSVVELAAGTGQWTARLARRGARVTAIDASPEMLEINGRRLAAEGLDADHVVADLLAWTPGRVWDAAVACFWLSHVPDASLAPMLSAMAAAVRPGGSVFVADKVEGRGHTARVLRDGRSFTVVDRTRSQDVLVSAFAAAGFSVDVEQIGRRFVAITGVRG
jgi:2-polyprenyl-3-methyl-5-hydroxy-6-metoxy-1,4-benzoquinol methylase